LAAVRLTTAQTTELQLEQLLVTEGTAVQGLDRGPLNSVHCIIIILLVGATTHVGPRPS
jgi:hypothetical protein